MKEKDAKMNRVISTDDNRIKGIMQIKKLILLIAGLLSVAAYSQNTIIYEAENAGATDSTKIMHDNTASQDKYVLFGKNSSVKWSINNPDAGWYQVAIRYRASKGDVAQTIDVNGKMQGVGFSMCDNWNNAYFKTFLQKGRNVITLTPGYGTIDVDYLSIPADSLYLLPAISPVQDVFYKDHPATITLYANAAGKKLESINADGQQIGFRTKEYSYVEGAYHITLSNESLMALPSGDNRLDLKFNDNSTLHFLLHVKDHVPPTPLTFIMFNVGHGNSVLVLLPNGKKLLIDSGKEVYAQSVIMPFMDEHHIDTLDYYVITHYHEDHIGAKDEIIKKYHVQHFLDYKSFNSGDTARWGNTVVTILNAYADATDENDRSMSFLLNWNGFTYSHGADNYATSENRILKKFGNRIPAQVFYANHHFHGSVNPNFIIKTNPALVVVSAQQAVYARGAYSDFYKEQTEKYLYASHARLIETLLTLETGTVVIRVNSGNDWWYETYRDDKDIYLPTLDK